jgi:cbb3-type cytochrome oxidase maturation protein
MEIVYLLVPLSVVLALLIIGLFAWALKAGQFDDLEREGQRIFEEQGGRPLDPDQD